MIPARGVHQRSGERLLLDEVGQNRLREQADRGHHDIEGVLLSARGRQQPCLGRGVPPGRDDLGVQLQIPRQLVALCAALEVLQDLRLAGPQARPVGIQVERVGVQMRLHIAGQARVGVDPPGAADAVLAVEDREVAKAVLPQEDSQRQPTRACADDSHRESLRHLVHPICRDCPPSTTSSDPVMNDACSETRNATASAISIGVPSRPFSGKPRLRGRIEHRGLDRAGKHGVDPDPGSQLCGGDLGEATQSPLRRAVGRVVGKRPKRTRATGVDDGRAVGPPKVFERRLDAQERAEAIDPPARLEPRGRLVGERGPVQDTGIVDQRGQ